jgi:hypothetical protein
MYKPKHLQTIKDEKLRLETSVFMCHSLVLLQAVIIGTPFILLSLLATELLQTYLSSSVILFSSLLFGFLICYLIAKQQYIATKLPLTNISEFQKTAFEVLERSGFRVTSNNNKFLAATCTQNRSLISDSFYAVYTKSNVLVFCICELPFPFSPLKSKSVIATIKARCKSG